MGTSLISSSTTSTKSFLLPLPSCLLWPPCFLDPLLHRIDEQESFPPNRVLRHFSKEGVGYLTRFPLLKQCHAMFRRNLEGCSFTTHKRIDHRVSRPSRASFLSCSIIFNKPTDPVISVVSKFFSNELTSKLFELVKAQWGDLTRTKPTFIQGKSINRKGKGPIVVMGPKVI